MYVTTSRKPSAAARVLARNIAAFLSGAYENRGKKSIDEVAARSRVLGHNRAIVISEAHGSPNTLAFMAVDDGWEWMKPEIQFSAPMESTKERTRSIGRQVVIEAEDKSLADLFAVGPSTEDDVVTLRITKDELSFSYGKKGLSLRIKQFKY